MKKQTQTFSVTALVKGRGKEEARHVYVNADDKNEAETEAERMLLEADPDGNVRIGNVREMAATPWDQRRR